MAHQHIPQVINDHLIPVAADGGDLSPISVGSAAWYAWLTDTAPRSFAFRGDQGNFTARRERQHGSWYWYAYRTRDGKLRKVYLGKPEGMTLERLQTVAIQLAGERRATTSSQPMPPVPQPTLLVATKLYVPRPRPDLVSRPRLIRRLDAGLAGTLTLISAPAGFGKTTLLSDWLQHTKHAVAWLSLDPGENDPNAFLRYLVAAIQTVASGVGEKTLALLQSPSSSFEALLHVLLNDLMMLPERCILVLDDYHVINAPIIHQSVTFVLNHLPPQLHLVLATRADPPLPLARLRARGALTELRAADLRFTPDEAAAFLTDVMSLPLSADAISALEARTEGWIAGLQFAALAMRDRSNITGFIRAFTGSHRFVVDYLAEEVLAPQPAHLQSFLLQTAVLDRLCASLCDAVISADVGNTQPFEGSLALPQSIGTTLARSQELLEELERANLFLVPLDDVRQWYRYHHLLAEVLRGRLMRASGAEAVAALHCRAAVWYEQEGLVSEGVHHALAAQDWEQVARMIEQSGHLLIFHGQVQTVLGWLNALPDAVLRARPTLCLLAALALGDTNQLEAAEARLQEAERSVQVDTPPDQARIILGHVALTRAMLFRSSGDLGRCVVLSQQALELLPETELIPRSAAMLNMARAYLITGDVTPRSEGLAAEVVAPTHASGNLFAYLSAFTNLARLQVLQGRLRAAAATYERAMQVAPELDGLRILGSQRVLPFWMG